MALFSGLTKMRLNRPKPDKQHAGKKQSMLSKFKVVHIQHLYGSAVLAVIFSFAIATLAAPAPATAAGGRLIAHVPTYSGWGEAYLDVYWDGYQNYAYMNHNGSAYGVATPTSVFICKVTRGGDDTNCIGPAQADPSNGGTANYKYYAGPVYSGPSAHTCIYVHGQIKWNGFWDQAVFQGGCS